MEGIFCNIWHCDRPFATHIWTLRSHAIQVSLSQPWLPTSSLVLMHVHRMSQLSLPAWWKISSPSPPLLSFPSSSELNYATTTQSPDLMQEKPEPEAGAELLPSVPAPRMDLELCESRSRETRLRNAGRCEEGDTGYRRIRDRFSNESGHAVAVVWGQGGKE